MQLNPQNLTSRREPLYFIILAVVAVVIWGVVAISMFGLLYPLLFGLMIWLANGLMVAGIRANSVEASKEQFGDLYRVFEEVAAKLEVKTLPRLYVLQSEGAMNAFATRHSGRDFVVVFSSLYESLGADSNEMRFLLGHELGHVKCKHIKKFLFLAPASWLPLIGTAYRRSVEETCDRYGTFAAGTTASAARAMTILAAGKDPGRIADVRRFADQYQSERGFFVSWYELLSHYPTIAQRTHHILSAEEQVYPKKQSRHPLAYIFAFLFCKAAFFIVIGAIWGRIIINGINDAKNKASTTESQPEDTSASENTDEEDYAEDQE